MTGAVTNSSCYQNRTISKRIRWLTEEAERLIECMPESIKPVVIFALATGLAAQTSSGSSGSRSISEKGCMGKSENAKAGKAIGVALNDTACRVLRDQIGSIPGGCLFTDGSIALMEH